MRKPLKSFILCRMAKRWAVFLSLILCAQAVAADSNFKSMLWPMFVKQIPGILAGQDKTTGRWGTGPIVITDQNAIYPLAVAWAEHADGNRYYHDQKLLQAIMRGGDFLISQQKRDGQWVFRTKDGSEWGDIYMPWTYSRWIRAYGLIRDAMPADERAKWEQALRLGFGGMSRKGLHGDLHEIENIPTHDAMALYWAGKLLNRPDWCKQAVTYIHKAVAAQNPGGFWTENLGPVVNYNFVYMDCVGVYYAMSHDATVLPALERGAEFHANFTYPDGRRVETIDERNDYSAEIEMPNVGFTFSPIGRAYILQQLALKKKHHESIGADLIASIILYGEEGPIGQTPGDSDHQFILGHNDAMVVRQKPWFICLSAYHTPIPNDRWIMDRQNFLSIYHDGLGVIAGGGNTKLTPMWSTFTAGDWESPLYKAGTTQPSYAEPRGLLHVPDDLKLIPGQLALVADYGGAKCEARVEMKNSTTAEITYSLLNSSKMDIEAHLTLLPKLGAKWRCQGSTGKLDKSPINLKIIAEKDTDKSFSQDGWSVLLPADSTVDWPVLPYDQYVKTGTAPLSEGRIVVTIPLGRSPNHQTVQLHIGD